MSELVVMHDSGAIAGTVREDQRGVRTLVYDASWRDEPGALALSHSLPLSALEHGADRVDPWLWGLLPDNDVVLERWGRAFHVSARNPFRLLAHVGEECAGAFQLVPPEKRGAVARGAVDWLDDASIAARLAAVRSDPSRTREPSDSGQFSLAGAQAKIALHRDGERWGVPSGRTPTTHILKPPSGAFDGIVENEHYCLGLFRALGLPTARSEARRFGDQPCLVVERFDRVRVPSEGSGDPPVHRIHQEDFCQALGIHPALKYQNEGGPSPSAMVGVLRSASGRPEEDVGSFLDALVLHWVIGGTDAHAKNYAILHGARGRVRLAPFYDVISVLPYPELVNRKTKLAMSIGGEYRLQAIAARHWRKLASSCGLDETTVLDRARALVAQVPDAARDAAAEVRRGGLTQVMAESLAEKIAERAIACAATLAA